MEASFELPEAEEESPQPDLPRLAQIGAQLRSAVDGSGSAVDGSGSAVDGSGSAVDGSGSAADGSGSAGAGSGKRSMPKVKKEWRWQAVETRGNAPAPREGHTSTAVENYLVMFGGCFLDKECFNDVQVLDTEEDRWLEPAVQGRPPMGREGHTATLVQDAIYVFGGSSQAGYMNDLHVLAVGLQNAGEEMRLAWGVEDVSGTPPTAREGHTATAVGTRIFVFGGFTEQGYSSDLFVLNTDDMAWERPPVAGVPPSGREGHTATLFRDRLIIFGGFTDGGCLNDVAVLDTSTRTWVRPKVFGSPPLPRQDASAVRRGHTILYTGGCNFARQQCYRDSFVLDLRKRQWRKAEFVKEGGLAPREDHTVTLVRDRVLLFGGCFLAEKCYDDTLELITGGAWECGGNDCSGHGSCHHGICYCAAGYVGADCSMEMKCPANCSGHGSCLSTGACACRSGWSGDACETKVECPNDCSGHGVCLPNEVCRCEEGWFGAHCGLCVPKDEYVCSGHGHCVMPEGEMGEGEATAEAESAGYIPTLAGSTDAKAAAGSGSGADAAGAGAGAGSAGAGSAGAGAAPALLQLGAGASVKASAKRALRSTAAAAALAADGGSGSSGSGSGSGSGGGVVIGCEKDTPAARPTLRERLLRRAINGRRHLTPSSKHSTEVKSATQSSAEGDGGPSRRAPREWLCCAVVDRGVGFSKADASKLFKPYTQIDAGAAQKGNATGLGLAVAAAIVRSHGGRIGAYSDGVGRGATFWFEVPLSAPRPSANQHTMGARVAVPPPAEDSATSPDMSTVRVGTDHSGDGSSEPDSQSEGGSTASTAYGLPQRPHLPHALSASWWLHPKQEATRHQAPGSDRGEGGANCAQENQSTPGRPPALTSAAAGPVRRIPSTSSASVHEHIVPGSSLPEEEADQAPGADGAEHGGPAQPALAGSYAGEFGSCSAEPEVLAPSASRSRRSAGEYVEPTSGAASDPASTHVSAAGAVTSQELTPAPRTVYMLETVGAAHGGSSLTAGAVADDLMGADEAKPALSEDSAESFSGSADTALLGPAHYGRPKDRTDYHLLGSGTASSTGESTSHHEGSGVVNSSPGLPLLSATGSGADIQTVSGYSTHGQAPSWTRSTQMLSATTTSAAALNLPAMPPDPAAATPLPPPSTDGGGAATLGGVQLANLRLLVVDDVASNRKLLVHSLKKLGAVEVLEAVDGRAAVDACQVGSDREPAVVFMDKEMPVMNGHDALVTLRDKGFNGRVIGVTGSAYQEDLNGFMERGADAVLTKPVSRLRLGRCLFRVLK